MANLQGILKSIQNIMWQDTGLNGDAQRIEQLGWMLFFKIFSDKDQELELMSDDYTSPIPKELHWENWAGNDEGMTGDKLLEFVDRTLFPTLRGLFVGDNKRALILREVFEGNNNYMKSGINIRKVLNKLNEIDFNIAKDRHAFGEIYETILKNLQSAGKSGEFYTPRAITQFITEMVDPQIGEKVLDPACGTGGFLTGAIEHLRKGNTSIETLKAIQDNVIGWEYKPLPFLLATTNLILHDVEVPQVTFRDALDQPLTSYTEKDRVNVILANPPFGGIVANGNEKNFSQNFRTKESADLFLILMIHLLKMGGRAGIVLPDASLSGDGVKQRVREKLLSDCNLHTIIRLPNSVFKPYAIVPTNLLFFDKGISTKEIWYYELGLPAGSKGYSKTNPLRFEELQPIRDWWHNRTESEVCWKVHIQAIKDRDFDLDFRNPIRPENNTGYSAIEAKTNLENTLSKNIDFIREITDEINSRKSSLPNLFSGLGLTDKLLEGYAVEVINSKDFVKELRGAFLCEAMKGNLTEQSEGDEAVEILIEMIEAEKQDLFLEGKIRSLRPICPIKADEIPHEVPSNWKWVRIGEISQHNSGKTLDSGRNTGVLREYITTSNLYWGFFNCDKLKQMPIKDEELERCSAVKGDLLVCEGGEAGRAAVWESETDICFQNHIHRVRPFGKINSYFLFNYFSKINYTGEINSYRKGMGISNMSSKSLASILLPLPPLAEQKRIVEKLEKLMAFCDELEANIRESKHHAETLLQVALKEALEPKG